MNYFCPRHFSIKDIVVIFELSLIARVFKDDIVISIPTKILKDLRIPPLYAKNNIK